MDTKTNIPEADKYLEERRKTLPRELNAAIDNDELFESVDTLVGHLGLSAETIEGIKYEILLILMRISPVEELPSVLVVEHNLELAIAVRVSKQIEEGILKEYMPLLINLPDDELNTKEVKPPAPVTTSQPEPQIATPPSSKAPVLPKVDPTLRERLHLRPEEKVSPPPTLPKVPENKALKPLTKEELVSSLSPKRTMAADIAVIKGQKVPEMDKKNTAPAPNSLNLDAVPPKVPSNEPGKNDVTIPSYSKPLTEKNSTLDKF